MKLRKVKALLTRTIYKGSNGDRVMLYGFAVCDTVDGKAYTDLQGDHIPSSVLYEAAYEYAKYSRVILYEHGGGSVGHATHTMPLTADLAEELGIESSKTGLLIGAEVNEAVSKLFDLGQVTGFSIGGMIAYEDDKVAALWIDEISLVGRPAQEPATIDAERGESINSGVDDVEKNVVVLAKFARSSTNSPENGEKDDPALDTAKNDSYPSPETSGDTPMTEAEKKALEDAQKAAADAKAEADAAKAETAALQKQIDDAANGDAGSDSKETEKSAPKVVYKSIDGDTYTDADDDRVVKLAKSNDDKELAIRKSQVPSLPDKVVEAVVRSGDTEAWDALVKQHEGNATVQKARTSTQPEDVAKTVDEQAKVAAEIAKSQGVPVEFASIEAAARVTKLEEAA